MIPLCHDETNGETTDMLSLGWIWIYRNHKGIFNPTNRYLERVWDWREILFNPTNRYYKAGTYSTLGVLTILANWQLGVTAGINQGA